jgi:hypothetical protein
VSCFTQVGGYSVIEFLFIAQSLSGVLVKYRVVNMFEYDIASIIYINWLEQGLLLEGEDTDTL